ncbi:MAG: hypothetical protein Q8Q01_04090 [archaeon]|nr:hypothetical protein [archaeon]
MKITIDTKHDSHDDIMKVMEILKHFVKKEEKTEIVDTTNMMSMFSDNTYQSEKKIIPDTPPDFTSFLNLAQGKREDKRNDEPKIEFF